MDQETLNIRKAEKTDLEAIVRLYHDDAIGSSREILNTPDLRYVNLFEEMQDSVWNEILVADMDGVIVGTVQIMMLPHLNRYATKRMQIEAMHVSKDHQSQGIGAKIMTHVEQRARDEGCGIMQLTSDKRRPRAHDFYERHGFEATHEGMKKFL